MCFACWGFGSPALLPCANSHCALFYGHAAASNLIRWHLALQRVMLSFVMCPSLSFFSTVAHTFAPFFCKVPIFVEVLFPPKQPIKAQCCKSKTQDQFIVRVQSKRSETVEDTFFRFWGFVLGIFSDIFRGVGHRTHAVPNCFFPPLSSFLFKT